MKLRYILTSLLAVSAFITACENDETPQLDQVKVSQSYIAIPVSGGKVDVTVNAVADWSIDDVPSWLTVNPASGSKGTTVVEFSAPEAVETNESVLHLSCAGATQLLTVLQMAEKVELPVSSCADIIAGADSKTFRAKGTCTAIANTEYGNWYLTDETGSIYIYGTLDAGGGAKNFLSLGIEVGDIVTVEGPKLTYGAVVELVDVTVINIEKSLIKVEEVSPEDATLPIEGGEFAVSLTVKGEGVSVEIPEAAKAWLSVSSINISGTAATVVFNAASNEGGDRNTDLTFLTSKGGKTYTAVTSLSQKGAILEVPITDFNASETDGAFYRLTGVVTSIADAAKGRFYIRDYSGETYVYNMGGVADAGIKEGDIVTLVGNHAVFNGIHEVINATFDAIVPVTEISIADFLTKEDSKEVYYMVTGKVTSIANAIYGNCYISDGTEELYVYGVYPGVYPSLNPTGDSRKYFLETAGIEVGDDLTIIGYKDTYTSTTSTTIEISGGIYWSHVDNEPITEEPVEETGIEFLLDSSLGIDNGTAVTSFEKDGITVTFDKGTGSNDPMYYTSGDAVRVYGGGTVTVSGAEMSKIEFTFGSSDGTNEITADNGTYVDGKWEGSASSVTFTVGGTSGNRRFAKIAVTKK
ncbi:MAG: BACON domain-containing protein [Candidatus Cryptobacteroides sp.]